MHLDWADAKVRPDLEGVPEEVSAVSFPVKAEERERENEIERGRERVRNREREEK